MLGEGETDAANLPLIPGRAVYMTDRKKIVQCAYVADDDINRLIGPHINIRSRKEERDIEKAIEKEQRQEAILSSLAKLDYLTRSQLQILHDLGSPRNTSRVMKSLEPFVTKFLDGEAVYYLTKEGRERTGAKKLGNVRYKQGTS